MTDSTSPAHGRPLRPTLITLAVCIALLASGGAALALTLDNQSPDESPRAAAHAATLRDPASGRLASDVPPEDVYDAAWDDAMLRDRRAVVEQLNPPRKVVDSTSVNATPEADLVETATLCARDGAKPGHVSRCYAFASEAAYDYKNYDAKMTDDVRATMPIVNQCWRVRVELKAGAIEPVETDVSDLQEFPEFMDNQGCPKSWKGGS